MYLILQKIEFYTLCYYKVKKIYNIFYSVSQLNIEREYYQTNY